MEPRRPRWYSMGMLRAVATLLALTSSLAGSLASELAVAGPKVAAPGPAQRKPAPEAASVEVLEKFVRAILEDKAGELTSAVRLYESANRGGEQANITYNIADLQRRMELHTKAIASYKKYLELAPQASDRKTVERIITGLEARPGSVVVDGEDLDAVVFIDGTLIGPSPVVMPLPEGPHTADRIGPTTYRQRLFRIRPGDVARAALNSSNDTPGNVVLSASATLTRSGGWVEANSEAKYSLPARQTLSPGRHVINPWGIACKPVSFEVPPGDQVTFVYLEVTAPAERGRCHPIKVRQQKVRFPR